ncbi:MAG: PDC sensor domain-containing protein [Treponema sp.]|jgi:hypothetical protein|nr:PDC sensor domain-containing protein [Treponema sp.]
MKNKRKSSFVMLFTMVSLLMIVFTTVSLSLIFFYNLRNITSNLTEFNTRSNVDHSRDIVIYSIEEYETTIRHIAVSITQFFKQGVASQEVIAGYLQDILEIVPNSLDLYYTNNRTWNQPGGIAAFGGGWIPDDDWDNTQRSWFTDAKNAAGQIAFSEPYVDAETGDIIITLSMTVFNGGGEDIGVVADDVTVNDL